MSGDAAAAASGLDAGAILLMALGEDCAAQVLRHLTARDVQRLGERMAGLEAVEEQRFTGVLDRFEAAVRTQRALVSNNGQFVTSVLRRALGDERATPLIERIVPTPEPASIEGLRWMDAPAIASMLRDEHPQVVAALLVHLDRAQAAGVLDALDTDRRADIALRIARLDTIDPRALQELDSVLSRLLATAPSGAGGARGGARAAAEIMVALAPGNDAPILDSIRARDADLAQTIEDGMFTFAELSRLDGRGMQRLLREVSGEQLVVALRGAEPALREHVLANMGSRAAEALREDLETRGPVRLADVEAEQRAIVKIARGLADAGEIMLSSGAGQGGYV